eukprot:jgi/Tetstr1/439455/TSEL_027888.t1
MPPGTCPWPESRIIPPRSLRQAPAHKLHTERCLAASAATSTRGPPTNDHGTEVTELPRAEGCKRTPFPRDIS